MYVCRSLATTRLVPEGGSALRDGRCPQTGYTRGMRAKNFDLKEGRKEGRKGGTSENPQRSSPPGWLEPNLDHCLPPGWVGWVGGRVAMSRHVHPRPMLPGRLAGATRRSPPALLAFLSVSLCLSKTTYGAAVACRPADYWLAAGWLVVRRWWWRVLATWTETRRTGQGRAGRSPRSSHPPKGKKNPSLGRLCPSVDQSGQVWSGLVWSGP